MWKDTFYFTKNERYAVLFLVFVIIVLLITSKILPYFLNNKNEFSDYSQYKETYMDFCESLELIEEKKYSPDKKYNSIEIQLFAFNPNMVDSLSFIRLGLKPFQVKNILKYRSKGGVFKTPKDFVKVYGLSENQFEKLAPYIQIPDFVSSERTINTKSIGYSENSGTETSFQKQEKYAAGTIIDLNLADTTELKKIPGIGPAFSKRIVLYRNKLGGFYSVEQLKEVWGITPEIYQNLKNWVKVNSGQTTKIRINILTIDELKLHPYISYPQAKAFVELRKKKGALQSFEQLVLLEEFTEKDIERLGYYISFK